MQGELVFCAVALHFVSDALHMTPACSWWSDYHAHIYAYSLLFWQDCVYSIALPIVVYIRQSAMDALVGSVIFIVRPDGVRISIGAHWIWTGVEREKLVFDFGNIWVDVFDTCMSMVIGSPCPCKHLMLLLCGDPRNSSRRYRGGGTAKRGHYHDCMSHTAINLTVLSCAKVRNFYRRDRSRTAAGPQNVGIPTIPGCRRDRSRRRRDHFTCKFLGAGPHTPFGNYNNIPGGVRWCFGGCEDFSEDVLSTWLALYSWQSSKWSLWTAKCLKLLLLPIRLYSASTSKLRPISSPSKQLIFWSRSFGPP